MAFFDNIINFFTKDLSHCTQIQYYAKTALIKLSVDWATTDCLTGAIDLYEGTSTSNGYSCKSVETTSGNAATRWTLKDLYVWNFGPQY